RIPFCVHNRVFARSSVHILSYLTLYSFQSPRLCLSNSSANHPHLHSFPTRRSSDLSPNGSNGSKTSVRSSAASTRRSSTGFSLRDRKSTRLNSSHQIISYAVFCLKKKKSSRSSP